MSLEQSAAILLLHKTAAVIYRSLMTVAVKVVKDTPCAAALPFENSLSGHSGGYLGMCVQVRVRCHNNSPRAVRGLDSYSIACQYTLFTLHTTLLHLWFNDDLPWMCLRSCSKTFKSCFPLNCDGWALLLVSHRGLVQRGWIGWDTAWDESSALNAKSNIKETCAFLH